MTPATRPQTGAELLATAKAYVSPVALTAVLLLMLAVTIGVYDAYARGVYDPPRPAVAVARAEDVFVTASQPAAAAPLSDADQLVAAVQRANQAFVAARGAASAVPLEAAATGEWLAQEQRYIAAMRGRFQTERWTMTSMEVVRVELRPDGTGFVCTSERWDGAVIRADGSVASSRGYSLSEGYYLTRVGGDWRVFRVEFS